MGLPFKGNLYSHCMKVFKKPPVYEIVPEAGPPPCFAAVVTLPDGRRFPETDISTTRCSRKADAEQKAAEMAWLELSPPEGHTGIMASAPPAEADPWVELRREVEGFFSDKAFASTSAVRLQHLLARQACSGGVPFCVVANMQANVKARCLALDPLCEMHPARCLTLVRKALSAPPEGPTSETASDTPSSMITPVTVVRSSESARSADDGSGAAGAAGEAGNTGDGQGLAIPGGSREAGAACLVYLDDAGLLRVRASGCPDRDNQDRPKRAKSEPAVPTGHGREAEAGRAAPGVGAEPPGGRAAAVTLFPPTTASQDNDSLATIASHGDPPTFGSSVSTSESGEQQLKQRATDGLIIVHLTVDERRRRDEERAAREWDKAAAAKQAAALAGVGQEAQDTNSSTPKEGHEDKLVDPGSHLSGVSFAAPQASVITPGGLPPGSNSSAGDSTTPRAASQYGQTVLPGLATGQLFQVVHIPADRAVPLRVLRLPVCGDGHYVQQFARTLRLLVADVVASRPASTSFMKTCRVYFGGHRADTDDGTVRHLSAQSEACQQEVTTSSRSGSLSVLCPDTVPVPGTWCRRCGSNVAAAAVAAYRAGDARPGNPIQANASRGAADGDLGLDGVVNPTGTGLVTSLPDDPMVGVEPEHERGADGEGHSNNYKDRNVGDSSSIGERSNADLRNGPRGTGNANSGPHIKQDLAITNSVPDGTRGEACASSVPDGNRMKDGREINWRASDLARCTVRGDAIIACVGPSYLDGVPLVVYLDVCEDDVQTLLMTRHPVGQYLLSRSRSRIARLPSTYRGGDNWQGKMPKAQLQEICDQLQIQPPQYAVTETTSGSERQTGTPRQRAALALMSARPCGYLAVVVLRGHPALHGHGHRHRAVCGVCGSLGAAGTTVGRAPADHGQAAAAQGSPEDRGAPTIGRWSSPRAFASKNDAAHSAALEALWGLVASRFEEPGAAPAVRVEPVETDGLVDDQDNDRVVAQADAACDMDMSEDANALQRGVDRGVTDVGINMDSPSGTDTDSSTGGRIINRSGPGAVAASGKRVEQGLARSQGPEYAASHGVGENGRMPYCAERALAATCAVCQHARGVGGFWEDISSCQAPGAREGRGLSMAGMFDVASKVGLAQGMTVGGCGRGTDGDGTANSSGGKARGPGGATASGGGRDQMAEETKAEDMEAEGDLCPPCALVRIDYVLMGPKGDVLDAQRGFSFELGAGAVLGKIDRCVAGMTAGSTRHLRLLVPTRDSFAPSEAATCHLTLAGFDLPPEQRAEERVFTPSLARQRIALVLDVLARKGALGSLIDVGCGNGAVLEPLLATARIPHLVGLDVDATPLRKLARVLARKMLPGGELSGVFGGGWAAVAPAHERASPPSAAEEESGRPTTAVIAASSADDGVAATSADVVAKRTAAAAPTADAAVAAAVTKDDVVAAPAVGHHRGQRPWVEIQTFRAGAAEEPTSPSDLQDPAGGSSGDGLVFVTPQAPASAAAAAPAPARHLEPSEHHADRLPQDACVRQHGQHTRPRDDRERQARGYEQRPHEHGQAPLQADPQPRLDGQPPHQEERQPRQHDQPAHRHGQPSRPPLLPSASVELFCGSLAERDSRCQGLDAAILIEVVEHLDPGPLACVGPSVLGYMRPRVAIVSTPNYEYNAAMGMPPADGVSGPPGLRNSDHRFEWTRAEFQKWAGDLATQYGYDVEFAGVGQTPEGDARQLGYSSQFAIFTK